MGATQDTWAHPGTSLHVADFAFDKTASMLHHVLSVPYVFKSIACSFSVVDGPGVVFHSSGRLLSDECRKRSVTVQWIVRDGQIESRVPDDGAGSPQLHFQARNVRPLCNP